MIIFEYLQYEFFWRALVVGSVVALTLSWLSGYIVMRREVFFTHAVAHTALLGVAVALLFDVSVTGALLVATLLAAYLVSFLRRQNLTHSDSLLEIVAQLGLALAVIVMSFYRSYQIELDQFLFGDILAIGNADVWVSIVMLVAVFAVCFSFHKQFLRISLSESLSHTLVKRKALWEGLLIVMLAFSIGLAIKVLGILLVAAFVTVPANIGKLLAANLRQVFVFSLISGLFSTIFGLYFSAFFDLPSGPSIVVFLIVTWFIIGGLRRLVRT